MRFLTVDHYYQYRRDMRIFLTFGQLCVSANKTAAPKTKNRKTWIPMLMKQLQLNISLKTFPKLEQAAAHLLYKESHPSPPKPGIALTSGTGNGGNGGSNPESSDSDSKSASSSSYGSDEEGSRYTEETYYSDRSNKSNSQASKKNSRSSNKSRRSTRKSTRPRTVSKRKETKRKEDRLVVYTCQNVS